MGSTPLLECFSTFSGSLKTILGQLSDGRKDGKSETDLIAFWNHVELCMKFISQEATKLSLSCSELPLPPCEDLLPLIKSLEINCIVLSSACLGLSVSYYGTTLKTTLIDRVKGVIQGLSELVSNLSESCAMKRKKYLQSTGTVWDIVDKFNELPKDNKEAVLGKLKVAFELLQDAHEEFDEALKHGVEKVDGNHCDVIDELEDEDEDFNMKWKSIELDLVVSSFGLVKTSKACLSKVIKSIQTNGMVQNLVSETTGNSEYQVSSSIESLLSNLTLDENPESLQIRESAIHFSRPVLQLDIICYLSSRISPSVDDLLSCLYPPILEIEATRNNICKLSELLKKFLEVARLSHYVLPADISWLDFLNKAVQHNTEKSLKAVEKFLEK